MARAVLRRTENVVERDMLEFLPEPAEVRERIRAAKAIRGTGVSADRGRELGKSICRPVSIKYAPASPDRVFDRVDGKI